MDKNLKISLIIAGAILLVIFLYPKNSGYGYGGMVPQNQTILRVGYSCFGIEYSRTGDRWGLSHYTDAGASHYCVGIPHSRQCYGWTTGTPIETERPMSCGK